MTKIETNYKIQVIVLKLIGIGFVLIGVIAAYFGPLEIYVFYLFAENRPFHYDGFGVGSIWFGTPVGHKMAYYLLATLVIPVGLGPIKQRLLDYWHGRNRILYPSRK